MDLRQKIEGKRRQRRKFKIWNKQTKKREGAKNRNWYNAGILNDV